jgi:hypothetical protein
VPAKVVAKESSKVAANIPHPELYKSLRQWRDSLAEEWGVPVYLVLAQKSILELIQSLPSNLLELEGIKGLGKTRIKQYGQQIIEIIDNYCENHEVERQAMVIPFTEKKIKTDTKKASLDLFKSGKTISEIALERGFTPATIEGHLAFYINSGEISVFEIVSKLKVAKIMAYIIQHPGMNTAETKNALGNDVSYGELRAVLNHLVYVKSDS